MYLLCYLKWTVLTQLSEIWLLWWTKEFSAAKRRLFSRLNTRSSFMSYRESLLDFIHRFSLSSVFTITDPHLPEDPIVCTREAEISTAPGFNCHSVLGHTKQFTSLVIRIRKAFSKLS